MAVSFTLTYAGPLWGAGNKSNHTAHKHELRKHFSIQMRRLFHAHPVISRWYIDAKEKTGSPGVMRLDDWLVGQHLCDGRVYIPLVGSHAPLLCHLDITILRPDAPGGLIQSGDIDNRLKTLFDALRMPKNASELGGHAPHGEQERFYCLLEDDGFISAIAVQTDFLLEPVSASGTVNPADVRISLKVTLSSVGWHPRSYAIQS